jgi:hypothetical protein
MKNRGKIMSNKHQLDLWVAGNPVHNGRTRMEGECTPDFSCCHRELLIPEQERIAFRDADEETRGRMLGKYLSAVLYKQGMEVVR